VKEGSREVKSASQGVTDMDWSGSMRKGSGVAISKTSLKVYGFPI
jgi:hypothetical protein